MLSTSTCPWAMMKNLLRSSPSTISLLPSETVFGLEAAGHPGEDGVGQLGEQRHAPQGLGREGGRSAGDVHADPLGLAQLDLGAVDAVDAAVDLHPRQQAQAASAG